MRRTLTRFHECAKIINNSRKRRFNREKRKRAYREFRTKKKSRFSYRGLFVKFDEMHNREIDFEN